MKKKFWVKSMALFVAVVFTATSVSWNVPVASASGDGAPSIFSPIDRLTIPEEMGTISRAYRGERGTRNAERKSADVDRSPGAVSRDDRTVILIQDAHAVTDAQENIRKILGHLSKDYGVRLVALEGAKGRMEPILFRTFPDQGVKLKILSGYEKRGELSGPEIAGALEGIPMEFQGMESWDLYVQNYQSYLATQQKKSLLMTQWNEVKKTQDAESVTVYDSGLKEFKEISESFREDRVSLLDLLLYLSEFKGLLKTRHDETTAAVIPVAGSEASGSPSKTFGDAETKADAFCYTELSGLISSIGYEKTKRQEALAPLVRKIADEFKTKYLRGLGVKTEMNFYNKYQSFMTGQIAPGAMLQYLVQIGKETGKVVKLTPALKKLLGHAEVLSELKGSRLAEELDLFLAEVEASLIKNPAQRELADKYRRLFVVKDLMNLELSHDALMGYLENPDAYLSLFQRSSFRQDLRPALDFYQAALDRDQAFMGKIETMFGASGKSAVVVVAGGFHTKGLERIFKEKGFPYAVVTPKMASLEGQENYSKVMDGDVSFRKDLKTTYFDALMRHSAKLLAEALPVPERAQTLKMWRDNLIRELAKEGRISEAGEYLPYIDGVLRDYAGSAGEAVASRAKEAMLSIVSRELGRFKTETLERLWKTFEFQLGLFTEGLKQLTEKKDLSPRSVSALLGRVNQSKPSFLAPEGKLFQGNYPVSFELSKLSPELMEEGAAVSEGSSPALAGDSNSLGAERIGVSAEMRPERPSRVVGASELRRERKREILESKLMENLQSRYPSFVSYVSDFLEPDSEFKAPIMNEIDKLADAAVLAEVQRRLNLFSGKGAINEYGLYKPVTVEDLFLTQTAGRDEDIPQVLANINAVASPAMIEIMLESETESWVKERIESYYLFVRALEALSKAQADDLLNRLEKPLTAARSDVREGEGEEILAAMDFDYMAENYKGYVKRLSGKEQRAFDQMFFQDFLHAVDFFRTDKEARKQWVPVKGTELIGQDDDIEEIVNVLQRAGIFKNAAFLALVEKYVKARELKSGTLVPVDDPKARDLVIEIARDLLRRYFDGTLKIDGLSPSSYRSLLMNAYRNVVSVVLKHLLRNVITKGIVGVIALAASEMFFSSGLPEFALFMLGVFVSCFVSSPSVSKIVKVEDDMDRRFRKEALANRLLGIDQAKITKAEERFKADFQVLLARFPSPEVQAIFLETQQILKKALGIDLRYRLAADNGRWLLEQEKLEKFMGLGPEAVVVLMLREAASKNPGYLDQLEKAWEKDSSSRLSSRRKVASRFLTLVPLVKMLLARNVAFDLADEALRDRTLQEAGTDRERAQRTEALLEEFKEDPLIFIEELKNSIQQLKKTPELQRAVLFAYYAYLMVRFERIREDLAAGQPAVPRYQEILIRKSKVFRKVLRSGAFGSLRRTDRLAIERNLREAVEAVTVQAASSAVLSAARSDVREGEVFEETREPFEAWMPRAGKSVLEKIRSAPGRTMKGAFMEVLEQPPASRGQILKNYPVYRETIERAAYPVWENMLLAAKPLHEGPVFEALKRVSGMKQMDSTEAHQFLQLLQLYHLYMQDYTNASFPFTFSMQSVIYGNKRPALFYREIPNVTPGYDLTQVLIVNGMASSGIAVPEGADVTEFFFLNGIYVGYGVTRVFTQDMSKLEMQFQVFPQTSHSDYGRASDHPKMKGIAAAIINRRLELLEELIPEGQASEVVVQAHQLSQRVTAENPPNLYVNQIEKKFSPLLKSSPEGKPDYSGGLVLYLKGSGPRVEVRRSELRTEKIGESGEVTYDAENRITKITTLDGRVLLERSFEKTPDNEIVHETVYSYDAPGVPAGSVRRVYQTVDGVHRRLAAQLESENDPEFQMTSSERVMVLRGEKEIERRHNDAVRMLMRIREKLQKVTGDKADSFLPDVIRRNEIFLLQKDLERFFYLKSGMESSLVRLLASQPGLDPTIDLFLVKAKALAGDLESQAEMKRLLTGTGNALTLYIARSYAYLAGDKTIFEHLFQSAQEMEWTALVANNLSDEDLALVAEKVMTLSRSDPEQYARLFLFLEKINDDRVADIVAGFLSASDLGGFAYEVVSASIRYLGEHPADKYLELLKDLTEKVSSEYQALIFEARMKMGDRTMIPEVLERFRELSTSEYPEENEFELETMMEILRDTHTKEALPDILRYFEALLARDDEDPGVGLTIYTLVSLGGETLTREKVLPLLEKNMAEFSALSAGIEDESVEDSEPYRMIRDIVKAFSLYSETWILPYLQKLANRLTYVKLINGVDYAIQSIRARGNFNIEEDSPDAFEKNLLLLVNSLDILASESEVGNGGRGGSLYYRTKLQSRKDLRERLITLIQQGASQQGAAMRFLAMFPEDVRKLFEGTPVSRHAALKAALVEAILENSMNDIITNYSERYLAYENLISLKEKNVTFKEIDTAFLIKELLARGIVAEDREIRALVQKSPYFRLAGSVVLPKLEIMNVSYRGSRQKEAEDARYSTKAITVGLFNYRGSEKGQASGIPVLYEWDIQLMADKESFRTPDKNVALAFYYRASEFSLDTPEGRFLNNVFGVSEKISRPTKAVRKRSLSLIDKYNFEAVKDLILQQEVERQHKGTLLGLMDQLRSSSSAGEALMLFGTDDTAPETMRGAVKMLKTKAGLLPAYVKFIYGHKDNGFDTIVEKVTERLRSGDLAGAKSLLDASYTIRFLEAEKKKIAGTIEDPSFELSSATGASATLKGTEDLPISSRIRRSDLRAVGRTIALVGLMGVVPFMAEAAAKGSALSIPRESIVKVQMKLGVDPVGVVGPKTIAALQKHGNFQIKSGKFDPQTKAIFDWVLRDAEGPMTTTKETVLPSAGKTLLTQISESLKSPQVSAPAGAIQANKALTPEVPDIMPDEKLTSWVKPATPVDEIVEALQFFNIIDAGMVGRVTKDASLRKELVTQLQRRLEVPSTGFFGNQTRKQVAVVKALTQEEASRGSSVASGEMPVIVISKEGAQPVSPEDPVVKSLGIPAHAVLYKKLFEGFRDYGFKLWSVEKQKDLVTLGIVAELMTRDVLSAETKEEIENVRELAARQNDLGAMRMGISTVEGGKGLAVNQKGGPAASSEMIEPRSAIDAIRAAGFSKNPNVLSVLYDGLTKDQKAFVTSLLKKDANQDANRSKMWEFLQNSDFQNRVVILYLHWRLSIYKLPLPSSDNLQQQAGTYQIAWAPGIFEYPRTLGHFLYANVVYDVLEKLSRGDKLTDRDRKALSQADSFSTRVETIATDMRKAQRAAMKQDFSKAKILMAEAEQKYAKLLVVMSPWELVPERFMVTWKLRDEMDRRNTRLKAGLIPQTREGLPVVADLRSMGMPLMPLAMTSVMRSDVRADELEDQSDQELIPSWDIPSDVWEAKSWRRLQRYLERMVQKYGWDAKKHGQTAKLILAVADQSVGVLIERGLTDDMKRRIWNERGGMKADVVSRFFSNLWTMESLVKKAKREDNYSRIASGLRRALGAPDLLDVIKQSSWGAVSVGGVLQSLMPDVSYKYEAPSRIVSSSWSALDVPQADRLEILRKNVDAVLENKPSRIYVVCEANQNRSPVMQLLLQEFLDRSRLTRVTVSSGGFAVGANGNEGEKLRKDVNRSLRWAVSGSFRKAFVSHAVNPKELEAASLILVASPEQYASLISDFPGLSLDKKMVLMTDLYSGYVPPEMPDPAKGVISLKELVSLSRSMIVDTFSAGPQVGGQTVSARSELRKTGKNISGPMIASEKTPYRFDDFLNRGFSNLNENLYGGKLLEEIDERIKTASGTLDVLLIGVGRGWEAIQLQKKYGSKIRVSAVNKEIGLFLDEEGFKTWASDNQVALTKEDREAFELVRKNLHILDVEKDLKSIQGVFDLAVMAYGVTEYLEDPVKAYNEILSSSLKPGGALFGSLGDIRVSEAEGLKSGLSWLFRLPEDSVLKKVGAGVRAPQGSSIPLRFERQEEIINTDGITHFRSFYAPVRSDVRADKEEQLPVLNKEPEALDGLDDSELDSGELADPPTETALHLPGYKHSFFPTSGFKLFWHGFKSFPFKDLEEQGKKQFWHRQDDGRKEASESVDPKIILVNNDKRRPRIYLNPVDENNFFKAREVVRRVALSMSDKPVDFKYLAQDFSAEKHLIDPSQVSPIVVTFLDRADMQEFYKRMKADPEYRGVKGGGPTLMSDQLLLEDQSVDRLACTAEGFVEDRIATFFAEETVEQFVEKLGSLSVGDINRVLKVLDSLLTEEKRSENFEPGAPNQRAKLEAAIKLLIQKKTVKVTVTGAITGTAPETLPVRMELGGQDVFVDVELSPDEKDYLVTVWHDYGNVPPRTFVMPRGEDSEKIVGRSDVPTLSKELPSWLQRISRSQVKIRTMKDNTVVLEQMSPVASTAFVTSDPSGESAGFVSRSAPPESQTRTFSLGRSWTNNGGEEMMLRIQFRLLYGDLLETTLLLNGMMLLSNDKPIRNVFSPESYNGTIVIGRTSSSPIVFPKELAQTLADSGVSGQHLDIVRWGSAWKIKPHKPQARVYEEGATLPLGDEGVSIRRSDVRAKGGLSEFGAERRGQIQDSRRRWFDSVWERLGKMIKRLPEERKRYFQDPRVWPDNEKALYIQELQRMSLGALGDEVSRFVKMKLFESYQFEAMGDPVERLRAFLDYLSSENSFDDSPDNLQHHIGLVHPVEGGLAASLLDPMLRQEYEMFFREVAIRWSRKPKVVSKARSEAKLSSEDSVRVEALFKRLKQDPRSFAIPQEDVEKASRMTASQLGDAIQEFFSREDAIVPLNNKKLLDLSGEAFLNAFWEHFISSSSSGGVSFSQAAHYTDHALGDGSAILRRVVLDYDDQLRSIQMLFREMAIRKAPRLGSPRSDVRSKQLQTEEGSGEQLPVSYVDASRHEKIQGVSMRVHGEISPEVLGKLALAVRAAHLEIPNILNNCRQISELFLEKAQGLLGLGDKEASLIGSPKLTAVAAGIVHPEGWTSPVFFSNHWLGYVVMEGSHVAVDLTAKSYLGDQGVDAELIAGTSLEDLKMRLSLYYGGEKWELDRGLEGESRRRAVIGSRTVDLGDLKNQQVVVSFVLSNGEPQAPVVGKLMKYLIGDDGRIFVTLNMGGIERETLRLMNRPLTSEEKADTWEKVSPSKIVTKIELASAIRKAPRIGSPRSDVRRDDFADVGEIGLSGITKTESNDVLPGKGAVLGRFAGGLTVNSTDIGDPEKTRQALKVKAEKELANMGTGFDASLSKLNGILGLMDAEQARNYLNGREFEDFMVREFREPLMPYLGAEGSGVAVEQVVKNIRKSIAAVSVIGGGIGIKGFVDTAIPLRKNRTQGKNSIEEVAAMLQSAIAELSGKAGEHAIGVMTNHSGADSAAVLSMLERMTLERLIVLYPKDKPLGRAFNIPGVPLTPLPFEGTSSRSPAKRAQQALASGNGNTVALWTSDLDVGNTGVYTVIAEIGRIADPQLKSLALDAVRFIFLKYASATPSDQQKMLTHPELLRQDLDKMGFGAVVQLKGNVLVFDMQKLADMFAAKQSIEQAA